MCGLIATESVAAAAEIQRDDAKQVIRLVVFVAPSADNHHQTLAC